MSQMNKSDKKAYEKPAIIHRQVLEGVAGACEANDLQNGKAGDPCTTINS